MSDIRSRPSTPEFREGWDRIYGKNMSTHKQRVLKRYPKAHCHMSQFSGMFFVTTGTRKDRMLAYEPSANEAWKQADINPKLTRFDKL